MIWSESDRNYLISNLDSSLELVLEEVNELDDDQWNWIQDENSWSIALIIEHLIVHDELFYREVTILSALPEFPPVDPKNFADNDTIFSYKEINSSNLGSSPSYMEPYGRWCSKDDAIAAYIRSRSHLVEFASKTDKDLRKYYTKSGRGPTEYRDLHQMLLISIAHTLRHLEQIRNIKANLP